MTTVRAIDLSGNEITIENVREISQPMGDVNHLYERCGFSWFWNCLIQCPDCRDTEDKSCGKIFVTATIASPPEPIEVDGKLVREILDIS